MLNAPQFPMSSFLAAAEQSGADQPAPNTSRVSDISQGQPDIACSMSRAERRQHNPRFYNEPSTNQTTTTP